MSIFTAALKSIGSSQHVANLNIAASGVFSHFVVIFLVLDIVYSFRLYPCHWNLLLLKAITQFKFKFSVIVAPVTF